MRKTLLIGVMAFVTVIAVLLFTGIVNVYYGLMAGMIALVSLALCYRIFGNEEEA